MSDLENLGLGSDRTDAKILDNNWERNDQDASASVIFLSSDTG